MQNLMTTKLHATLVILFCPRQVVPICKLMFHEDFSVQDKSEISLDA